MRVSIDKDDPGYVEDYLFYRVFFNGEETNFVITADEEKGLIVYYATNKYGKVVRKHGKAGALLRRQLHGDVRIERVERI